MIFIMVPTSILNKDKLKLHRLMPFIIKLHILSSYIYFYLIKLTSLRLYLSFCIFQARLYFLLDMHWPGPERNYKWIFFC